MTETTTDTAARAAFIAGFRALAEFIEAHPALPVPRFSVHDGLTIYPVGSDADKRATVERVAQVLQVAPNEYGLYEAARQFGGCVVYRVVSVPASAIADVNETGEV